MNNFTLYGIRSQLLKKFLLVTLGLALVVFAGSKLLNFNSIEASSVYIPTDEERIFALTNNERLRNSSSPLAWDYNLYLAARAKAHNMLENNYFEHVSPSGMTPWDFIEGSGYKYTVAGENLAIDFYSFNDLMNAWMNSPTHKANIIDTDFVNIGVAVVRGDFEGRETIIVVQMFGYPSATNQ